MTGDINGVWCNFSFYGALNAKGDVIMPQPHEILLTVNSAPVTLKKNISLWVRTVTVTLATVDVSPHIRPSPIPIGPTIVSFESGLATDWLRMTPSGISLTKKNGFIEVRGSVALR